MKKVNCILLVDDDPTTNFLNEELIADNQAANHVHVVWNGKEALEYLNKSGKYVSNKKTDFPRPNIIFLDINMPIMDGFEFLEKYKKVPKSRRAEVVIIFLTTSDSLLDKDKVGSINIVSKYIEKPLRKQSLFKIINDYHANIF